MYIGVFWYFFVKMINHIDFTERKWYNSITKE